MPDVIARSALVGLLLFPALPASAAGPSSPPSAATVSGTLTYEGRSVKLTHVACASTSWPLVRLVFTTTALPRELMGNETAKHDFLAGKGAPRIDFAVKFRDEGPLYLMAGLTDPASTTNPGSEPILGEPPAYTFHKKVVDDTRIAGRLATGGAAKTTANERPYSFDVTFDVPRKACE
jgi:hypothetical protein